MSGPYTSFDLLLHALARLNGRLDEAFSPIFEAKGGNRMERLVLSAVVEAPHSPTVPQISRSLGHPRQVVQRAANTLAAAGLVALEDNPDHKRASLLIATPGARATGGGAAPRRRDRRGSAAARRRR